MCLRVVSAILVYVTFDLSARARGYTTTRRHWQDSRALSSCRLFFPLHLPNLPARQQTVSERFVPGDQIFRNL